MSDRDPIAKETRDEAAQWYARLNNKTISTDTLRAFQKWKREGDHRQAYMDIAAFWRKVGELAKDEDIVKAGEEALERKKPLGPGGKGVLGALIVAGLGAALAYGYGAYKGAPYETAIGEQRIVRLADGSKIRLDTNSRLRVRLTGEARRIELQSGQAFFEVAHDPSRPFVVRAAGSEVRALGTRFDVRRRGDAVQVVLVEGRVRVNAPEPGSEVTLQPGQQVEVRDGKAASPTRVDAASATSWTAGRLVFQNQPLSAAIDEVNRYSRAKVVLDAPGLTSTPVSGSFESGDTEAFVNAVKALHDLRIASRSAREIRLEPAS